MNYLPSQYSASGVIGSIVIAIVASFVTLDLARRVQTPDRRAAHIWHAGGSVVMGTGIWAMHFVGMLSFSLPIELGYRGLHTFVSWVAAVLASAVALHIAADKTPTSLRLSLGALAMGAGICAMHYTGMLAMDMQPGIVWNHWLVAASVVIAVGASGAALAIFFWLRGTSGRAGVYYQVLASLVMGAAIAGMHYTGMAAAGFPEGSVCLSANAFGGQGLGSILTLACVVLLAITLMSSTLDARLRRSAQRLASSLEQANVQLQEANEELRQRAFLDPLTSLPNRLLFEDRLRHALSRVERASMRVDTMRTESRMVDRLAVMFVDLDGFKPVNDSKGHAAGDQVLKEIARRLQTEARESDTVARVGGDEFLVLMEDAFSVADCVTLARRLVEACRKPMEVNGEQVQVMASVGVAIFPGHGHRDKLVANADAAMYAAKRAGGNTYAVFEAHMGSEVEDQLSLLNDLREAVRKGELHLHYQPKIDGRRGRITSVEALLRWDHATRGSISPGVFIPVAERFGLISQLGEWVIEEACRQMRDWARAGMRMRVAVNVSVHQLREDNLVPRIQAALERNGVDASQLLCEITESVAMEDIKATQRAIEGLASIGVFLSIDDFGTGYSSLAYLRQLPARQLKIDHSFVRDLESSADARAVVDAVIRLAHALGLRVVAEGVETKGQGDILLQMDCDELQGFYFARPMPASTLLQWSTGAKPAGSVDFTPSIVGDTQFLG